MDLNLYSNIPLFQCFHIPVLQYSKNPFSPSERSSPRESNVRAMRAQKHIIGVPNNYASAQNIEIETDLISNETRSLELKILA
jgi:hypothetical protein